MLHDYVGASPASAPALAHYKSVVDPRNPEGGVAFDTLLTEEHLCVGFLHSDIVIFDKEGIAFRRIGEGIEVEKPFFLQSRTTTSLEGNPGMAGL